MAGEGAAAKEFRSAELAGKYLTFALSAEEYGLPVLKVREIIKMMDITEVPQVPAHVRGVLNLRGKVIPVVDLRLKFNLTKAEYTDRTCIIVVEMALRSTVALIGVVVFYGVIVSVFLTLAVVPAGDALDSLTPARGCTRPWPRER